MSRRLCLAAALAATAFVLIPSAARACGGFYANAVEVASGQWIIVQHRAGVETYTFRPHFCGEAKDFGVILPIPSALSTAPALASNDLYDQLKTFTEPEVVEVCRSEGGLGCGASDSKVGDYRAVADSGVAVNVLNRGRVGNFEYALLQATTATAFTDWLDQNGFPHGTSDAAVYESYVAKSWYFVAFKVAADTAVPASGLKLCGDLGPIQLSFASEQPVVPARIAAVNIPAGEQPVWRVFLFAAQQQALAEGSQYTAEPYFAGPVQAADLTTYPALATQAQAGDRLTVLDVRFPYDGAGDDIAFAATSAMDFRSKNYVEKDCGAGCTAGGSLATDVCALLLMAGVLEGLRRRRCHRQG